MHARRYLIWYAATFLALAGFTATVNFSIDPYLVFGNPRVEGVNQVKTEINDYVRVAKAFEPFRRRTDVLLAGNSRIEMGLDPNHTCFKKLGLQTYNLGLPGAGVGQQLNHILNVIYLQRVERVFLSVDFVDFLVNEGSVPPAGHSIVTTGNLPKRFDGSDNPDFTWTVAQTRFQALLSLDALVNSFKTVLLQGPHQPDRLANGFNPAADFAQATLVEGPRALFEQKMVTLRERFNSPEVMRYADGTLSRSFKLLSDFLEIAAAQEIEVIVFTNPFHQEFWNLLNDRGLLELHADWLDEIVGRVGEAPGRVSMWDFSADSEFIHESVPPRGIKGPPLNWFWEPSHYTKALGDKMLESMLAEECGSQTSFGRQLVSLN